ncbi:hypothetical protein ACIGKP_10195, partial [Bacillus subtilis]
MNEQETIQEKAILVGCQLPHITDGAGVWCCGGRAG